VWLQVRAVIDGCGRLVSLYDTAWERELVPSGAAGNVFM
jgi:alpha-mannosidase